MAALPSGGRRRHDDDGRQTARSEVTGERLSFLDVDDGAAVPGNSWRPLLPDCRSAVKKSTPAVRQSSFCHRTMLANKSDTLPARYRYLSAANVGRAVTWAAVFLTAALGPSCGAVAATGGRKQLYDGQSGQLIPGEATFSL